MAATLSVHLVTWNGERYINELCHSLRTQTYRDWELHVFDNQSSDNTYHLIQDACHEFSVPVFFTQAQKNIGFAGGHNQLYQQSASEYILLLNQDMYLTPTCLENMMAYMTTHDTAAAVSPRLMRWNCRDIQSEKWDRDVSFTDDIDTLGLQVYRRRQITDMYAGASWQQIQQHMKQDQSFHRLVAPNIIEVFGVSGAFPLYRMAALKNIAFDDNTIFDSAYHSYKEDVDLAFRLRQAGYRTYTLLDTVAYHDRSVAGRMSTKDIDAVKNKQSQSSWVKYHSYKNHLMTLIKNEYWQNMLLDLPFILWYEMKKMLWYICFDRSVISGLFVLPKAGLMHKRNVIVQTRAVSWKELRIWWTS